MWVYVVVKETRWGDEFDKIFTSQVKANDYANQQKNISPYNNYRVAAYWAE